jgi:hypothetical protein
MRADAMCHGLRGRQLRLRERAGYRHWSSARSDSPGVGPDSFWAMTPTALYPSFRGRAAALSSNHPFFKEAGREYSTGFYQLVPMPTGSLNPNQVS